MITFRPTLHSPLFYIYSLLWSLFLHHSPRRFIISHLFSLLTFRASLLSAVFFFLLHFSLVFITFPPSVRSPNFYSYFFFVFITFRPSVHLSIFLIFLLYLHRFSSVSVLQTSYFFHIFKACTIPIMQSSFYTLLFLILFFSQSS